MSLSHISYDGSEAYEALRTLPEGAIVRETTFRNAQCFTLPRDLRFERCTFEGICFTMPIERWTWQDCTLNTCSFRYILVSDCCLLASRVMGTTLTGTLQACTFTDVSFVGGHLSGSIKDGTLTNVLLETVSIEQLSMVRTTFLQVRVCLPRWHEVMLDGCHLRRVTFELPSWVNDSTNCLWALCASHTLFKQVRCSIQQSESPIRILFASLHECRVIRSDIARPVSVTCVLCGTRCPQADIYKKSMCYECANTRDYTTKNSDTRGKRSRLPSFSFEFEVTGPHASQREDDPDPIELLAYGFVRTYDTTVESEYKSPIYQNMRVARGALALMDTVSDRVGENCGTHIHVGMTHRGRLLHHIDPLMRPLTTYLLQHPEETTAFWGRYFGDYRVSRLGISHRSWVNPRRELPTVEWRLCRFTSARQFKTLLTFLRHLTAWLDRELDRERTAEEYAQIGKEVLTRYQQALSEGVTNHEPAVCPTDVQTN